MKNSIRITGGNLKGKKIPFDFKSSLRPTSSKLREVLFNWLQFEIQNFQCLDLFAGTGALGIEALSRGADKTVFVESNKKNYIALKTSLLELNLKSRSMLLFKDGMAWIKENDLSVFDLIFLDFTVLSTARERNSSTCAKKKCRWRSRAPKRCA